VAISSIVDNGTTVVMGDITVNGTTSTLTTTTNDINLVPGGGEVNVTGHILSDTTNTRDLGTSANAWRSIFGTKLTATGDRINISTVHTPTTNAGASGDLIGDISADASYIYYCTATWVSPGSAAIWKRVAIATW
jgi:hypothetical protein